MDKKMLIGLGTAILIIASIGLYLGLRPTPAKAPATGGGYTSLPDPYVEHGPYYDIAANYPTSTPLTASGNGSALESMQSFIIDAVSQFKKDGNFDNLTPADIKTLGFDQGRKYTFQIVYLLASSPRTVSYIFTTTEDTGGAHPNEFFTTFTFDTKTPSTSSGQAGAALALADLFAPGSDYLDTLSGIARARLPGVIGQYADASMIADGTTPEAKNFENFFLDNGNLDILFAPYAVASYAAGPQTLQIPLTDIASILKSDYTP